MLGVSPTKTDELIMAQFGIWTRVGSKNRVLGDGLNPH